MTTTDNENVVIHLWDLLCDYKNLIFSEEFFRIVKRNVQLKLYSFMLMKFGDFIKIVLRSKRKTINIFMRVIKKI